MTSRLDLHDDRIQDLLACLLIPYSYGAGEPKHGAGAWPPDPLPEGISHGRGLDCSGFAQAALVHLGLLVPSSPDRTADNLFRISTHVPEGMAQLGDLAFYGSPAHVSHVMVVLGNGAVIGACGGTSKTNGDDPKAAVQVQNLHYRNDLISVGRII